MKLAFSTLGCPDWSVKEIAEFAAKYSYDGVELRCHVEGNHIAPAAAQAEVDETKKLFADAGVEVFSLAGYPRFTSADASERQQNVAEAKTVIDLAAKVGAQFVRFFGGRIGEGASKDDAIRHGGECLAELGACCDGKGVRVAMETHDDFCAAADLVRMLDAADSPNVVACWDLHHPLSIAKEPIEKTAELLAGRVGYCHVKDAYNDADGKRHIVMLGAGDVPIAGMLGVLKADGFDGYLSFEWEKKWHPEIPGPEIAFPQYAFKMREIMEAL